MLWTEATNALLQPLGHLSRLGLVTDVDGTISPIVNDPDQARVTPRSRELLDALRPCCALVAVVSGRAAADVQARVGLAGLTYIGNHGLERWSDGQVIPNPRIVRYRPQIEAALRELRAQETPGLFIEDKGATLSVHYRQCADPQATAERLRPVVEGIASAQDLHFFQGRMVFELRPPVEINKGTAFRHLIQGYRLDAAIYLGDDTTDVDALRAARQLREHGECYAVGLGVQSTDMPTAVGEAADVLAAGVTDVESFLSWLLTSRKASSTC